MPAEVPGLPGLPGPLYVAGVPAQPSAVGPVSGLMYIDGRLGGSSSAPEAELHARLVQGAIGDTRLAKVRACMRACVLGGGGGRQAGSHA
eukprot:scaffold323514_cov15-Tisochrysis_lutea.AAC.1